MMVVNGKPIMNPLVCDTNIWYDIAAGTILPEKSKRFNLIGTGVNIFELASTPKMVNDPDKYLRTLKAMLHNHELVFKDFFLDHILAQFSEEHLSDSRRNDELLKHMLIYIKAGQSNGIPQENYNKALVQVQDFIQRKKLIADSINNRISLKRSELDTEEKRKEYGELDLTHVHRADILTLVEYFAKDQYNKTFNITVEDKRWQELEFFMVTWDKFFRNLILTQEAKLKANDFMDLMNLVYVQPGVKYTTREKKWKNLFKSDEVLSGYFIEL